MDQRWWVIEFIIVSTEFMRQLTVLIGQEDYCDESELVMCEYARFPSSYFQGEIDYIQKWLAEETTTPLIIAGNAQSGKKSLLCSFLRENKDSRNEWLHIAHFGSVTPVYSHILYRILVELRTHFKIEQRVDLNQEKLRRYFKYWLEVVSDLIEKQFLGYVRQEVPKVVIVIEGVDDYTDLKGNMVQPQFWLPSQIPSNVKIIISTKGSGEGLIRGATIFRHHFSEEKRRKIIDGYNGRVVSLHAANDKLSLYQLQLVERMIEVKPTLKFGSTNFRDIISEYIKSSQSIGLTSDEIKSLLYILSLTGKGMKIRWIQKIVNLSQDKWSLFLKNFAFLIVQHHNYFIISNKPSRRIICQLTDPTGQKIRTYRQAIAHSIRTESMHLRGLEESVYQLLLSESYLELKEVISRIDNFILLYNPLSKDLLCQCWVKLQQIEQYDPVFEYNRAIQTFTSHYYPKEEDLYRIIFQLCMFFKEYSEFQNAKTPQFRHPLIRGEIDQLQDMGMYQQLKCLTMVGKSKSYKLKPLQKMSAAKVKKEVLKKDVRQTKKKIEIESIKKSNSGDVNSGESRPKHKDSQIDKHEVELAPQMSRPATTQEKDQLAHAQPASLIEDLNVSIVTNQQKFKRFFANSMKEYLDNYFQPMKKIFTKGKQLSFQSQDSDNEEESFKEKERQFKFDIEKYKESLILKKFKEYLEQNYHKSGEEVSCYYYKQWLWLQFPWLCQTVKHVYSNMIRQCLPGSIHFMSPLREFTLIREVIRITKNAKENQMGIFTEKKIQILPLKYSAAKEELTKSKYTRSGNLQKSIAGTKRTTLDEDRSLKLALNISMLEEEISKEKQYYAENFRSKYGVESRTLKNMNSMPNLNLFVTQHQKQSRMLPLLNKSKFCSETTTRKTQKQNAKDSRDFTMMIRRYNEIKHENDMLVIKIEEMKKITLMQVDKSKEEQAQLSNRLKDLQSRKGSLQRNFSAQQQLEKKLQVIIKVCDLNKMYGSESDYLSTYLGSLKQMILLQEQRVKDIKQKIALSLENSKVAIKDLRTKRKTLKACQQNATFANQNGTHQKGLAIPLDQIQQELKEQIRATRVRSKNIKSKKQIGASAEDYAILEGQLGIIFGSVENEQKIAALADVMDKQRQLKVKNLELAHDYQQRKGKLEYLRSEIITLKESKANEKALQTACNLIEKKRQLQQLRQRNELLFRAIETLEAQK